VARAERSRTDRRDPSECRCLCGSLVARRVPNGVELKCRRCKRTVVLPLEGLAHSAAPAPEAIPLKMTCGQRPPSPEPCRLAPRPELS